MFYSGGVFKNICGNTGTVTFMMKDIIEKAGEGAHIQMHYTSATLFF